MALRRLATLATSRRGIGIGLVLGVAVAVVVVVILGPRAGADIASAADASRQAAQPLWFVVALVALVIALVADAATLVVLVRHLGECTSVLGTAGVGFESYLAAGATSFGGLEVPFVMVRLKGVGVSVPKGGSIIMAKGLVHVTVLVMVAALALTPVGATVLTSLQSRILLGVIAFLCLLWLVGSVLLRGSLGLNRLPAPVRDRLTAFWETARLLRSRGWRLGLPLVALQIVYWVAMLSLVPLILLALGWRGDFKPLIVGQAVLQVLMPLSPLPGGAGVAELGYLGIIGRTVPRDLTVASLVIWRAYTWVLPMALGGFVLGARTLLRRRREVVGS